MQQESDKHQLVRESFDLTRDILFHKAMAEFFDDSYGVEKYPDPAEREARMRAAYNAEQEEAFPAFEAEAMQFSEAELTSHRDYLKNYHDNLGEMAWCMLCDEEEIIRVLQIGQAHHERLDASREDEDRSR